MVAPFAFWTPADVSRESGARGKTCRRFYRYFTPGFLPKFCVPDRVVKVTHRTYLLHNLPDALRIG
jgi:hypothetical protein